MRGCIEEIRHRNVIRVGVVLICMLDWLARMNFPEE